ncbi:hypothetical protein ALC53_08308 [Atta colombica]|uniref:Uncharacterized protein n=1 Tax=Atta colombica TaxID=520822 RepID=A0A195BAH9_9HYME|nr:hypothetical protein ALC53_08308 [Atta colombica]
MSLCGAVFSSSIICDHNVVVDGVVVVVVLVLVVVVGIVVILSVVVVVVVVLVVDGVNVVKRVDKVVAVVVRLGNAKVVVDGVVDGVVQVVVEVDVGDGEVNASAIDLAVVVITRPRAVPTVTTVLVTVGVTVVDLIRGASRNCAMSRGSVPNMAPAFRIECSLMLSANVNTSAVLELDVPLLQTSV